MEAWNYCDFLYQTLSDSINGSGSWIHLEQSRQTCNTLHPTRSIWASTLIIVRSVEQLSIRPHSEQDRLPFLFISRFDNFSRRTFQHVPRIRHRCCWLYYLYNSFQNLQHYDHRTKSGECAHHENDHNCIWTPRLDDCPQVERSWVDPINLWPVSPSLTAAAAT